MSAPPPLGHGRIAQFICGIVMILLSITVFCRARIADVRHEVVPSYRYATWMSVPQAYVAFGLCFACGLVIIGLGIAAARRESKHTNDANI
jgi:protein-S-isoprenylcysteine O-methyltransferase Ste14